MNFTKAAETQDLQGLAHPFGTSCGYTEPAWISRGEVSKGIMDSGYGIETDDPNNNQVVLEISIMAGPAPNDLVCTDTQVFRYTIQVEHDDPYWPYNHIGQVIHICPE